jgi:hypothetical protein
MGRVKTVEREHFAAAPCQVESCGAAHRANAGYDDVERLRHDENRLKYQAKFKIENG